MSVDKASLITLIDLIIEADEEELPLGLKLPDIRNPDETKGDDTPQDRAAMRLTTDTKKADTSLAKLDSKRKTSGRQGIRQGKDATVDFRLAFDTGTERKFRSNAKSALTKLNRVLDRDEINPREVIPLLKKIDDNPHQNVDAKRELQKTSMPKMADITRDINIASQPDEDGEQQTGLADLIRALVTAQRDAIDSASVGINSKDEHQKQKDKKIRS